MAEIYKPIKRLPGLSKDYDWIKNLWEQTMFWKIPSSHRWQAPTWKDHEFSIDELKHVTKLTTFQDCVYFFSEEALFGWQATDDEKVKLQLAYMFMSVLTEANASKSAA